MKRLRPALACVCTLAFLLSTHANAEGTKFGHEYVPGQQFQDALKGADLAREKLLNVRDDSAPGRPKRDAQAKGTPGATTTIYGTIMNNQGTPVCGLVLANGQFMFSCSPNGTYSLSGVPYDSSGIITLFGFASGHFPYQEEYVSGGRADILLYIASGGGAPSNQSVIVMNITDSCNNGIEIHYKFYDETSNPTGVWPSSTSYYYTSQYGATYTSNLLCTTGNQICYGASSGGFSWGVGLNNTSGCSSCCTTCQSGGGASWSLSC